MPKIYQQKSIIRSDLKLPKKKKGIYSWNISQHTNGYTTTWSITDNLNIHNIQHLYYTPEKKSKLLTRSGHEDKITLTDAVNAMSADNGTFDMG